MAITVPTAFTVATYAAAPVGPRSAESNLDLANGNKFPDGPGAYLLLRNTTAGAIGVDVLADNNGVETKIIDGSLTANKVAANGVAILGPFPPRATVHDTNSPTNNGQIIVNQLSGIAGDLKATAVVLDRNKPLA